MGWLKTLVAGAAIALAGCGGGESTPPAGSEGSATSLDIQIDGGDNAEAPKDDAAPAEKK